MLALRLLVTRTLQANHAIGPLATRLQGAALAVRAAANRGSVYARRRLPPVGGAVQRQQHPPAGKGSCRLRSGDHRKGKAARVRVFVF
ncbi:hypothetical protein GW17_00022353 [Ensete ventricosum]|nr:hypothetical protein GW17_00022353 [Ensete ventricosum]